MHRKIIVNIIGLYFLFFFTQILQNQWFVTLQRSFSSSSYLFVALSRCYYLVVRNTRKLLPNYWFVSLQRCYYTCGLYQCKDVTNLKRCNTRKMLPTSSFYSTRKMLPTSSFLQHQKDVTCLVVCFTVKMLPNYRFVAKESCNHSKGLYHIHNNDVSNEWLLKKH